MTKVDRSRKYGAEVVLHGQNIGDAKKHAMEAYPHQTYINGYDDPEIIAYVQVRDLTNKNKDDVFVFNGWMFSSSPSIAPFDHPVYDVWLVKCY